MHYKIEQDDIGVSGKLTDCHTITDINDKLLKLYPGEAWWTYEGGLHVRLHKFPRGGILARLFGKGTPRSVFYAVKVTGAS